MTLCTLSSRWLRPAALALAVLSGLPVAVRAQAEHQVVLDAREAFRKKDKAQLSAASVKARQHPLAPWVDYWELTNRLSSAQVDEIEAFYTRWSGTYVEDRLRNDWLLELGKRRDWASFSRDYPRFRMNDDREVSCYALLTQHLAGQDVREAARSAWFAQRDLDDGCNLLASTLFAAGQLTENDAWQEARTSIENNRPRAARAAAGFVSPAAANAVAELSDNPARFLARAPSEPLGRAGHAGPVAAGGHRPAGRCRTAAGALANRLAEAAGCVGLGRHRQAGGAEADARSRVLLPARLGLAA